MTIGGPGTFSYNTISLGNYVYIGPGAFFSAEHSRIVIGDKVLFGPQCMIMGGDHRIDVVGSYMFDVKNKLKQNDRDVVIQDDVWIGARAIILKGVTIGEGSVIGAGSIVTKPVPPYSVVCGIPARVIRQRFTPSQQIIHQNHLKKII